MTNNPAFARYAARTFTRNKRGCHNNFQEVTKVIRFGVQDLGVHGEKNFRDRLMADA